ncbi:hypothetical protein R1sor_011276 [Riccia sorocarpa]|uniref:Uncharacterized protein n=1 Tax=Riccia sorocarpa TaxID=122646 RepID=A0ABD3I0D7_9MARC
MSCLFEGELVDQDPPRHEAVVRSDRDKKLKQTAVEEGPLALALRHAVDNRTEAQLKHAIKDERFCQNSLFIHRWFRWFTQETVNRTPIEHKFFTSGSKKGVANFHSHLMELAIEAFLEEKNKPDTRPWETTVSEMSQRLARFLEEVSMKWDQMYEEWLKSKEFKDWTEEAVRVEGEKQFICVPRATMKNEAEQAKWRNTAQILDDVF